MSRGYQKLEIDEEAIRTLMNDSKTKEEFRRYQSLYLRIAEKMPTDLIAKITGLSQSGIQSIHSLARTKGLASLASRPKGGRRRSYLSIEEEKVMLSEIEKNRPLRKLISADDLYVDSVLESSRTRVRSGSVLRVSSKSSTINEFPKRSNAINGGVVEIGKVHKLFQEKVGSKVAKYTAYRLLHRHGWRKIAPRSYHPNQKADAIETFKKTGQLWSKMPS